MYVTCMTCVTGSTRVVSDMCVTCMSELNQAYLCWGSLVVKDIFAVKVSMNILLLPHALPKLHTCPGCAHTPPSCTSEGRVAVSPIWEFSAFYEARESVDVDGQALCLLRCQDIRGNKGLRGCSPSTEKGVYNRTEKLNKSLPLGNTLKIGLCA